MPYDPTQEVRFAVVMYGGVSLAIYMNGVAQELLRAVRATANLPGPGLTGTELVYREIGTILYHGREPGKGNVSDEVRTRIVVDILSGTSAGGINAVFLAKALARKNRDLKQLEAMWLKDADINTLLNDGLDSAARHKASLLNSTRMYELLVQALGDMDQQTRDGGADPLADRIDLFVTTTDLNGLKAPIELTDEPIDERIHRMVFRFECEKGSARNDFAPQFNPMLAFAARCTSSFPTAFEPMKYTSIPERLRRDEFKDFFDRYEALHSDFRDRPFADGGYLDNKPFSYAVDAIEYRDADRPVTRKLLFIDPTPEYSASRDRTDFDFVDNTLAAATDLPRYETIRGDIDRVNQQNRVRARLEELIRRVQDHQELVGPIQPEKFIHGDLSDTIAHYGEGYGPYHHRKVFDVTDWLARVATRVLQFNEDSDDYRAILHLVRVWRDTNFQPVTKTGTPENQFLLRYDMDFRMRRLQHLRLEIDRMLKPGEFPDLERTNELKACRAAIQTRLSMLRRYRHRLESRTGNPLTASLIEASAHLDREVLKADLKAILSPTTELQRHQVAKEKYDAYREVIEKLAASLAKGLRRRFTVSSGRIAQALDASAIDAAKEPARRSVRESLWKEYQDFEVYDQVSLQFLSGTGVRESGTVEIFRISPADTKLKPDTAVRGEEKLAGIKLGHFGAFLSEDWRANDIMWGRLDGAERIITALLPDPDDAELREHLISKARDAILKEEFDPVKNGRLMASIARYLHDRIESGADQAKLVESVKEVVEKRLAKGADRREDLIRIYYRTPPDPPASVTMGWASRATRIVGEMFDALSDEGPTKTLGSRLQLAGTLLARIMAFTLPDSIGRVLLRHWLRLVALAALLLIAVGSFVGGENSSVKTVGWVSLGAALALGIVAAMIGRAFRGAAKKGPKGLARFALDAVLSLFCLVGAWTAGNWVLGWVRDRSWFK